MIKEKFRQLVGDKKAPFWGVGLVVFTISLVVHSLGFGEIGRTWDEAFKVETGALAIINVLEGNTDPALWEVGIEHPMVAKYVYGLAELPRMIRLDGRLVLGFGEENRISDERMVMAILNGKSYGVDYGFTGARMASVIANSLTVGLVAVLVSEFLGLGWGFIAGLVLLLIPRFTVMGQLVTFESLSAFFFLGMSFCFREILKKEQKNLWYFLTGIWLGLAVWTRYNNVSFIPFLVGWWVIDRTYHKKKEWWNVRLLIIPVVAFILGILIWPLVWNDFPKNLLTSLLENSGRGIGISSYYARYFLFTTPIPVLVGLALGVARLIREEPHFWLVIFWWFLSQMLFVSFLGVQMGGTRYAFVAYPAMAMLVVWGWSWKGWMKWVAGASLIWMAVGMFVSHPYYLDYYNELIGGTKGAVAQNYDFSWWGEGQNEASSWLDKNATPQSRVGLRVTPLYVFPPFRNDLKLEGYGYQKLDTDYLVVSRKNLKDEGKEILEKYETIYEVKTGGETLVSVMKLKK